MLIGFKPTDPYQQFRYKLVLQVKWEGSASVRGTNRRSRHYRGLSLIWCIWCNSPWCWSWQNFAFSKQREELLLCSAPLLWTLSCRSEPVFRHQRFYSKTTCFKLVFTAQMSVLTNLPGVVSKWGGAHLLNAR